MTRIARLFATLVLAATLLVATPDRAYAGPGMVSQDCAATDTTTTGYHGGICVQGYLFPYGNGLNYVIHVVYGCAHWNVLVTCSGVDAFGHEYVSPYGWLPAHRFDCGIYNSSLNCYHDHNIDNGIPSIVLPHGCHHWVGEALSVTLSVGSARFRGTYRLLDYTVCP